MSSINPGLQPDEVARVKKQCREAGQPYVLNENEPQGEEYAHFLFTGHYEGKEVVFDAVLYTLRLHHMSVLYEMAEDKACDRYPEYNRIDVDEDNDHIPEEKLEEIELFKAEIMDELEENEEVKVQEYVNLDPDFDYGIALEACLNVEEITPAVISRFVKSFQANTIELDKTLYSFKHEDE